MGKEIWNKPLVSLVEGKFHMTPLGDMTSTQRQGFLAKLTKPSVYINEGFSVISPLTCSMQRWESVFRFRYYISGCWQTGVCPEAQTQDGEVTASFVRQGWWKTAALFSLETRMGI